MVDRLRRARSPAPTHVLLGMNAHINYDMPQALIAVITYEEFGDPAVVALRAADHRGLGRVLADRVAAEDDGLTGTSGSGSVRSRLLKLINKRGSERVLRDPHEKVWANALAFEPGPRAGTGRIRAGAGGASGTRRDQGGEASGGGPGAAEARGHGLRRPPASCGFLTGPDWLAVRPRTVCSVWHCTMESGPAAVIGGRT